MSMDSSWSDTRGGDIIDLDRYMRNTVRPPASRSRQQRSNCNPELVVDGGAAQKSTRVRQKRYSHDSGLSDTSYSRHRRVSRPHRRQSNLNEARIRETTRQDSSNSLRQFRTICEQTLLEQQRQIAQVAQLCEKLTLRAEQTERNQRSEQKEVKNEKAGEEKNDDDDETKRRQNLVEKNTNERTSSVKIASQKYQSYVVKNDRHRAVHRREQVSSEISEITSSSWSIKDPRRKDKHRSQQCKTYKLIMSKLDELNHVFQARAPPAAPRRASSTSVSVCDKLVATDALHGGRVSLTPGVGRRVTQTFAVDVAPSHRQPKTSVVNDSVVKVDGGGSATSVGDPRCGFDLDDPVHLYSQAKRLQTLTVMTRRGRSETRDTSDAQHDVHDLCHDTSDVRHVTRSVTLCALCRNYWRNLRNCLMPMFSAPEHCQ